MALGLTANMIPLTLNVGWTADWRNLSGGAAHFCMPLFSSGLLCHHLSLQLTWDVGASLSVCRWVKLVFSFQLRFSVLNAKPCEKPMCRTWVVLPTNSSSSGVLTLQQSSLDSEAALLCSCCANTYAAWQNRQSFAKNIFLYPNQLMSGLQNIRS